MSVFMTGVVKKRVSFSKLVFFFGLQLQLISQWYFDHFLTTSRAKLFQVFTLSKALISFIVLLYI